MRGIFVKANGSEMEAAIDNAIRLLQLGFPAGLGALAGAFRLFEDPRRAVDVLNRYALTFGFPALILRGLLQTKSLPDSLSFWLLWPLVLFLTLAGIRWLAPRGTAGTLALVACFGNVAYLGLPYVLTLFDSSIAGSAALAVSIHVTLAVTLGPLLLEMWGKENPGNWWVSVERVLRLPLFWAPLVGLGMRFLPITTRSTMLTWVQPIAGSAAPVALFLIGLHLYLERRRLAVFDKGLFLHLSIRQLIIPALMLLLSAVAISLGWLTSPLGRIQVILASMPAAITTFSMAHHAGLGEERVAGTIVWSSILALVLLPGWSWLAGILL
jgi:predicted permease